MKVELVLALPEGLEVTNIDVIDDVLTISAVSTHTSACCPLCSSLATRVHGHYTRTIADLPCAGRPVRLLVQVRKCFCEVSTCARKIFVERIAPFVKPWARVTTRLSESVQTIGFATGGMLGARVTDRLGIQTCWMTILRRMMALPTTPVEQVVELGIDDFAFRRGRKFGSILVDMQSHNVIDLLPDRKAETAKAWMKAHHTVNPFVHRGCLAHVVSSFLYPLPVHRNARHPAQGGERFYALVVGRRWHLQVGLTVPPSTMVKTRNQTRESRSWGRLCCGSP